MGEEGCEVGGGVCEEGRELVEGEGVERGAVFEVLEISSEGGTLGGRDSGHP